MKKSEVVKPQKLKSVKEDSIIDVNKQALNLTIEEHTSAVNKPTFIKVPNWESKTILSLRGLAAATKLQKDFYEYFELRFLDGDQIDLEGNLNYAYVLYHSLINRYKTHKNFTLLQNQFKRLVKVCPELEGEIFIFTLKLQLDANKSFQQYKSANVNYSYNSNRDTHDPNAYRWGSLNRERLHLNGQEVVWLNKFPDNKNAFISIEACGTAVMKQYVFILAELNKCLNKTDINSELQYFTEQLAKAYEGSNYDSYGFGSMDYNYYAAEERVYLTVFRRVENSVRALYLHKRKVSTHFPNDDKKLARKFEKRLGNTLDELIREFEHHIELPDLATEIELNNANKSRWKDQLAKIKGGFEAGINIQKNTESKADFIEQILKLESTNKENPNIKSIFFDACKFMAKYDRVLALQYYAKYTYYNYHLQSKHKANKPLTKALQKLIFTNAEQEVEFRNIIIKVIQTSNIEEALNEIPNIFIKKRRQIKLNKAAIEQVEQKHEGTVELLNEYLETEDEQQADVVESANKENTVGKNINQEQSLLKNNLNLNEVEENLILKIAKNAFQIAQTEVEAYALKNGLFKNQLIDHINEQCAGVLDGEALIEEEDEYYIIEKSYYKEIAK